MIEKGDIVFHVIKEIHGFVLTPPNKEGKHCVISDLNKEFVGLESKVNCHAGNLEILSKKEKGLNEI